MKNYTMKKILVLIFILPLSYVGIVQCSQGEEGKQLAMDDKVVIGVISSSENYFAADDAIYQIVKLSDKNSYFVKTDKTGMKPLFSGMQIKIHLAGPSNKSGGESFYKRYVDIKQASKIEVITISTH